MSLLESNREAWNQAANADCDSSIPLSSDDIRLAREGDWRVRLTPLKWVPRNWFPSPAGCRVLCVGSGGGQQVPMLAAAGASVVSLDLSDEQLRLDGEVAKRFNMAIETQQGDMTDLEPFADESFDVVFNPVSTLFVDHVERFWRSCFRVLKPDGILMSGSMNPSFFLFDHEEAKNEGVLRAKFPLPYSDLTSLSADQEAAVKAGRKTVEFGHTLEALIGSQLEAGFQLTHFYEDYWKDEASLLNVFSPTSFATRSVKRH